MKIENVNELETESVSIEKVKQYDISSAMEKWMNDNESFKKFILENNVKIKENLFIIVGTNGIIVSYDFEGVHWKFETIEDEIKIDLWKNDTIHEDGSRSISCCPTATCTVRIKEILEDCAHKEYDVGQMVRIFGSRLDTNYHLLLQSLKDIGIDLSKYNTVRYIKNEVK